MDYAENIVYRYEVHNIHLTHRPLGDVAEILKANLQAHNTE